MPIPLCPVCRCQMSQAVGAPAGTWKCENCAGVWFSATAMAALAESAEQPASANLCAPDAKAIRLGKLICPACFEPTMVPVGENPIEARSCPRCHGLFVISKEMLSAVAPHLMIEDVPSLQNETANAIAAAIGRELALSLASVVIACWLP